MMVVQAIDRRESPVLRAMPEELANLRPLAPPNQEVPIKTGGLRALIETASPTHGESLRIQGHHEATAATSEGDLRSTRLLAFGDMFGHLFFRTESTSKAAYRFSVKPLSSVAFTSMICLTVALLFAAVVFHNTLPPASTIMSASEAKRLHSVEFEDEDAYFRAVDGILFDVWPYDSTRPTFFGNLDTISFSKRHNKSSTTHMEMERCRSELGALCALLLIFVVALNATREVVTKCSESSKTDKSFEKDLHKLKFKAEKNRDECTCKRETPYLSRSKLHVRKNCILLPIFIFATSLPAANAACYDTLPRALMICNATSNADTLYCASALPLPLATASVILLSPKYFPGPWDAVLGLRFAALTPATTTAACGYTATQPPAAPIIESVRSDKDGSLTVEFNSPAGSSAGWKKAMVIDGTNQSMWHYDSPHWTSAELLDDGVNKKTEYFNREANRIKVEMHYGGSVRAVVWAHNLGKSLQQIFASDKFVASDIPEKDWHDLLGEGVAAVDTEWAVQGFNARYLTYMWPLGEKLGTRLGIYMSSLYHPTPNAMIGVGLQELEKWTSGDAERADLAPAAGAHCGAYIGEGVKGCTSHTATKVVVYVDDGACVNYRITTNPPTPATIVSSSPATVTGLQLTSAYAVEVRAVNTAGASSTASALGTSKPCRCSCNLPNAAAITSSDSHQTGTVTVHFDVPADTPADCTFDYTLRASPGNAVAHVVASPATLTGLDTSSVSYTIGITASNLLGSGPTTFSTAGIISSANNGGWDGLANFVASVQPGSVASFVLGPGVWNVSHPIAIANIDMTIRGSAAGGTVLDARKLIRIFAVTQRGILHLHGPLTLANVLARPPVNGAIAVRGRSKFFARGVTFTKCAGRVIMAMDARVEILDCNFTEIVSPGNTGVIKSYYSCTPYSSADDDEDLHVLSITGSRFERNAAAASFTVRSFRNVRSCSCCCLMGCAL
jgi:hypothetical protein